MSKNYRISEIFDSPQGEGYRSGQRSIFIRLSGCNLWNGDPQKRATGAGACAEWCDTEFTTKIPITASYLCETANSYWPKEVERWVVFTGGEPFLQLDDELVNTFKDAGWLIAVETNGITKPKLSDIDSIDWLCVSPKLIQTGNGVEVPDLEITKGNELKIVVPGVRPKSGKQGWTLQQIRYLEETTCFDNKYIQPQDVIDELTTEHTVLKDNIGNNASLNTQPLSKDIARKLYELHVETCTTYQRDLGSDWFISFQGHKLLGVR